MSRSSRVASNPVEGWVLSVATTTAWAGTAVLLGLAATRALALDDSAAVAMAQSTLPHVLLPAWAAAGFALVSRRRALAVVAGAVAVAHLAWLLPEVRIAVPVDDDVRAAPQLTVFSANLLLRNERIADLIAEIRDVDADIVALQEYDRANRRAVESSGVLDAYQHRIEAPADTPFGALLASKVPFVASDLVDIGGRPVPRAVLGSAIGPIEVLNVHLSRPDVDFDGWKAQHRDLSQRVRGRTIPMIVAGDFNATTSHRPFRDLLGAGLVDAHRARGDGLSTSWPNDRGLLPPVVRIDHLLTTDELVVRSVRNGTGAGSDHLPIVADVALVGPR
jgi:endonuclease/exonuclease/phosphatase (EEP) superfamily protein YafD